MRTEIILHDLYAILDVPPDAPVEALKPARNVCLKKWHPDVHKGDREEANHRTHWINTAYEVLSGPERRLYDAARAMWQSGMAVNDAAERCHQAQQVSTPGGTPKPLPQGANAWATWEPPMTVRGVALSPDQRAELKRVAEAFASGKNVATLTGYAGSGKTTCMLAFMDFPPAGVPVELSCPTNKAGVRLTEVTGHPYRTLHARLYGGPIEQAYCPECADWTILKASVERSVLWAPCKSNHPVPKPEELKTRLAWSAPESPCFPGSLLVVDEASMVGTTVYEDLRVTLPPGARVLFVGDPGQLSPVNDTWGPPLKDPTAHLTTIHRQGKGSKILELAENVRNGNAKSPFNLKARPPEPRDPTTDAGEVLIQQRAFLNQIGRYVAARRASGVDVTCITYTNRTRGEINEVVREAFGTKGYADYHNTGITRADRLLVRSTSRGMSFPMDMIEDGAFAEALDSYGGTVGEWFAGEVYTAVDFPQVVEHRVDRAQPLYSVRVMASGKDTPRVLYYIPNTFAGKNTRNEHGEAVLPYRRAFIKALREWMNSDKVQAANPDPFTWAEAQGYPNPFRIQHVDYGECLTAHASQGSQWAEVHLIWDSPTWGLWFNDVPEGRRYAYTAVTRAAQRVVIWIVPGK